MLQIQSLEELERRARKSFKKLLSGGQRPPSADTIRHSSIGMELAAIKKLFAAVINKARRSKTLPSIGYYRVAAIDGTGLFSTQRTGSGCALCPGIHRKAGRRGQPGPANGTVTAVRPGKNFSIRAEFTDVASGLNQTRSGLVNVLKLAEQGEYKKLLIEYPDRLARFGYAYIERHLRYCGVEIIAIAEKEPEDAQSELVRDLLAIVTSFSARLYGARGGKKIRQGFRELIAGAGLDEETEKEQKEDNQF